VAEITVPESKKPRTRSRVSTRDREPALVRQAEETLADIKTLWRDLVRNPFSDAKESGLTGPR